MEILRFLSSFALFLPLVAAIEAKCATEDHPSCAQWARRGYCYTSGNPTWKLQKYCPKACPNSGCVCPIGSVLVGHVVHNVCVFGTRSGFNCCVIDDQIRGPCLGGECPLGYKYVQRPDGHTEGEAVSVQALPGVCAERVQRGRCPKGQGCPAGYQCFTAAEVCCPA